MASILKKVQQKKDQKPVKATNLNVLNQQEVIEDKIASSLPSKKEEDAEQIDLSSIKAEKKVEEEIVQAEDVAQSNKENFTWGDTKDIDDQEALKIAEQQQAFQTEKKEDNGGKKIVKSWVPQKRDDANVTATFDEEESMPELNTENLNKKTEKKQAPTMISRSDEPSSSSANPPRFQNSSKGGFKQLELTEQQKKLLEIEEKNKKEYRSAVVGGPSFGGPSFGGPSTYGSTSSYGGASSSYPQAADTSSALFGQNSSTQPPRFTSKKVEGNNFVPLQKSDLDLKQEEAQKRAEERIKELKASAATQVPVSEFRSSVPTSEFRSSVPTSEFRSSEPVAAKVDTTSTATQESRPRFLNSKAGQVDNSKPLVNPEDIVVERKDAPTTEETKPGMKFVNNNKTTQGPNFKPIETKELQAPVGLENKKYITKKEERPENTEKKERSEKKVQRKQKDQQNQNDSESSSDEDADGFQKVKSDKPKKRNYNKGNPSVKTVQPNNENGTTENQETAQEETQSVQV